MARPNTALTGIAGVHHVVSELSRRGMVALPTIRNTAGYDVIVTTPDGTRHANIQVKASEKRRSFFPMPESRDVRAGRHDYYVLLSWIDKEKRYDGYMLSGRAARDEVRRAERFQGRRIREHKRKGYFPSISVSGRNVKRVGKDVDRRAKKWRKTWLTWTLLAAAV